MRQTWRPPNRGHRSEPALLTLIAKAISSARGEPFEALAGTLHGGTVFTAAARVVALVDRFSQHLHTVDLDAESWRQTKNEPPPKPTKTQELNRRRVGGEQLVGGRAAARPRPSGEVGNRPPSTLHSQDGRGAPAPVRPPDSR
ncbi:MAG: hypothetical protein INH37_14690 [Myxococcaceae bacterium]|nr:hypothetical protein [Myxococcaceae bacterium]